MAQFDSMVRKNKIHRLGVTRQEVVTAIREAEAVPVEITVPEADTDYSEYMNVAGVQADAVNRI